MGEMRERRRNANKSHHKDKFFISYPKMLRAIKSNNFPRISGRSKGRKEVEDDVVYTEQPQSSFFGVAGLTKQLQTIGNTCDSDKNVGGEKPSQPSSALAANVAGVEGAGGGGVEGEPGGCNCNQNEIILMLSQTN